MLISSGVDITDHLVMHHQLLSLAFLVNCTAITHTVVSSAGHVSADPDSAEDVAEDADAAVDEEEDDEEEVLIEEDQMQPTVCML